MLLVISGAGASYDSAPHLPPPQDPADGHAFDHVWVDRPPLANQLFEDRPEFVDVMQMFQDCVPLIPSLRKQGVVVEQELTRLQEQAEAFPRVHSELAAIRYYLHLALQQCQDRWHKTPQGHY